MSANFSPIYADIVKIDDEQRMVFGYASTEKRDHQGEVVRKDAIEQALPDYLRFSNIREMHKSWAVGVAREAVVDSKGLWIGAHIVDDEAWKKAKVGVYKGFSIGGKVTGRDRDDPTVITSLDLTEISLVDRPANPEAIYTMVKRVDGVLRVQPVQKWDCGLAEHQHHSKNEASECMVKQAGVLRSNLEGDSDMSKRTVADAEKGAADALAQLSSAIHGDVGKGCADDESKENPDEEASETPDEEKKENDAEKRDFSQEERDKAADSGAALPDGSFPIKSRQDLKNAIKAHGRAKDKAAAKAHIIARAKALGATDELPEGWGKLGKSSKPGAVDGFEDANPNSDGDYDDEPDGDEAKRNQSEADGDEDGAGDPEDQDKSGKAAAGDDLAKGTKACRYCKASIPTAATSCLSCGQDLAKAALPEAMVEIYRCATILDQLTALDQSSTVEKMTAGTKVGEALMAWIGTGIETMKGVIVDQLTDLLKGVDAPEFPPNTVALDIASKAWSPLVAEVLREQTKRAGRGVSKRLELKTLAEIVEKHGVQKTVIASAGEATEKAIGDVSKSFIEKYDQMTATLIAMSKEASGLKQENDLLKRKLNEPEPPKGRSGAPVSAPIAKAADIGGTDNVKTNGGLLEKVSSLPPGAQRGQELINMAYQMRR